MKWNNKNKRRRNEEFKKKVNSLVNNPDRLRGLNTLHNLTVLKKEKI